MSIADGMIVSLSHVSWRTHYSQSRGGIVQFDWFDAVTARTGVRWNRTQDYPSVEARSVPMRYVAYAFIGSPFAPLRNAT